MRKNLRIIEWDKEVKPLIKIDFDNTRLSPKVLPELEEITCSVPYVNPPSLTITFTKTDAAKWIENGEIILEGVTEDTKKMIIKTLREEDTGDKSEPS